MRIGNDVQNTHGEASGLLKEIFGNPQQQLPLPCGALMTSHRTKLFRLKRKTRHHFRFLANCVRIRITLHVSMSVRLNRNITVENRRKHRDTLLRERIRKAASCTSFA